MLSQQASQKTPCPKPAPRSRQSIGWAILPLARRKIICELAKVDPAPGTFENWDDLTQFEQREIGRELGSMAMVTAIMADEYSHFADMDYPVPGT